MEKFHIDNPFIGQSDDEILKLSQASNSGCCNPLSSWTAEANWQGYATRYVARLPGWLPLAYVSDHGVQCDTALQDYETNHNFGVFCTWNHFKFAAVKQLSGLKFSVKLIANPMALYWRSRRFTRRASAKGTIVFLTHSGVGETIPEIMSDEYANELAALPEQFQPVVLCVHRNDVLNGCLSGIRKYEFPVLTIGWAGAREFGDRFYDTISNFAFATSTTEMSAMYYCVDFGIPFFLYGKRPQVLSNSTERESEIGIGLKHTVDLLFRVLPNEITPEQQHFCDLVIGRYCKRDHLRFICFVWGQLISFANLRRGLIAVLLCFRRKFD